jgi:hypothetical protein
LLFADLQQMRPFADLQFAGQIFLRDLRFANLIFFADFRLPKIRNYIIFSKITNIYLRWKNKIFEANQWGSGSDTLPFFLANLQICYCGITPRILCICDLRTLVRWPTICRNGRKSVPRVCKIGQR